MYGEYREYAISQDRALCSRQHNQSLCSSDVICYATSRLVIKILSLIACFTCVMYFMVISNLAWSNTGSYIAVLSFVCVCVYINIDQYLCWLEGKFLYYSS
jgi:hypothetical protein